MELLVVHILYGHPLLKETKIKHDNIHDMFFFILWNPRQAAETTCGTQIIIFVMIISVLSVSNVETPFFRQ